MAFQWVSASVINGLDGDRMPISTKFDISYGQTMGTVMMNLGCATVIPSWVNIKAMKVQTQYVMWATVTITTIFYITIGVFFSLGFDSNDSNNSFQALLLYGQPAILCKFTVAMYSYVMLLPSVPVNFTVSYQNLVQNKVCGKRLAAFLTFVVPILICIPLQTRDYLFLFLTWTSLIFASVANFIMPILLYLKCVTFRRDFNTDRILTFHQLKLLAVIHSVSDEIGDYIMSSENLPTIPGSELDISPSIILSAPRLNEESPFSSKLLLNPKRQQQHPYKGMSPDKSFFKNKNVNIMEYSKISIKPDEECGPLDEFGEYRISSIDDDEDDRPYSAPTNAVQLAFASLSEFDRIGLRSVRKIGSAYPRIDKLTYVDPREAGLAANWLDEDVPDPEVESESVDQDIQLEKLERSSRSLLSNTNSPAATGSVEGINQHSLLRATVVNAKGHVLLSPQSLFDKNSIDNESKLSRMGSKSSSHSHSSMNSLPRHPLFRTPAFRAVPVWFPIAPYNLAVFLLISSSTICLLNVLVNGYFSVSLEKFNK
jgi:hypothetical protein